MSTADLRSRPSTCACALTAGKAGAERPSLTPLWCAVCTIASLAQRVPSCEPAALLNCSATDVLILLGCRLLLVQPRHIAGILPVTLETGSMAEAADTVEAAAAAVPWDTWMPLTSGAQFAAGGAAALLASA